MSLSRLFRAVKNVALAGGLVTLTGCVDDPILSPNNASGQFNLQSVVYGGVAATSGNPNVALGASLLSDAYRTGAIMESQQEAANRIIASQQPIPQQNIQTGEKNAIKIDFYTWTDKNGDGIVQAYDPPYELSAVDCNTGIDEHDTLVVRFLNLVPREFKFKVALCQLGQLDCKRNEFTIPPTTDPTPGHYAGTFALFYPPINPGDYEVRFFNDGNYFGAQRLKVN